MGQNLQSQVGIRGMQVFQVSREEKKKLNCSNRNVQRKQGFDDVQMQKSQNGFLNESAKDSTDSTVYVL